MRGRERENEPAGMTFNLESFAYHCSIHCDTKKAIAAQRHKEAKRFLSRIWKNFKAFPEECTF